MCYMFTFLLILPYFVKYSYFFKFSVTCAFFTRSYVHKNLCDVKSNVQLDSVWLCGIYTNHTTFFSGWLFVLRDTGLQINGVLNGIVGNHCCRICTVFNTQRGTLLINLTSLSRYKHDGYHQLELKKHARRKGGTPSCSVYIFFDTPMRGQFG